MTPAIVVIALGCCIVAIPLIMGLFYMFCEHTFATIIVLILLYIAFHIA